MRVYGLERLDLRCQSLSLRHKQRVRKDCPAVHGLRPRFGVGSSRSRRSLSLLANGSDGLSSIAYTIGPINGSPAVMSDGQNQNLVCVDHEDHMKRKAPHSCFAKCGGFDGRKGLRVAANPKHG